jgi:phospholipase C
MLSQIDHVVVLMLENRSFDCMLGQLYPKSPEFDGLALTESNTAPDGTVVTVWNVPGTDQKSMTIPDPDPGELFTDMNTQLFGGIAAPSPPDATMSGFIASYMAQKDQPAASYDVKAIMHYFRPEQVPVLSQLARQFAVCDRWHAAAPCQTWPNRFFAHTATANGYENNDPPNFPYEMPTIFNRFPSASQWKIYFHDFPQSLTLTRLWPHLDRFRLFDEFLSDAKAGTLPSYCFIEPRYFAEVLPPNDQHPPHLVTFGEQLMARIYNALRAGPGWTKTLLVITYDEHGGLYDHVPPPRAQSPEPPRAAAKFAFDRYGVRVPAVIVSPYIPQGTVMRPPGAVPFDHTSIIATVRNRFGLGPPLTQRDRFAPDLDAVLSLAGPTNLGPEQVEALAHLPNPADLAGAQSAPPNDLQMALLQLAAHFPDAPRLVEAVPGFNQFVATHLDQVKASVASGKLDVDSIVADASSDVTSAAAFIRTRLANLFRSL